MGICTAVLWPVLLNVVILAYPIVSLLLGSQWTEVAPLAQIMAGAMLLWFNPSLTGPTLIAAGAIRHTFLLALASRFIVGYCAIASGAIRPSCRRPDHVRYSTGIRRVFPCIWFGSTFQIPLRELAASMSKSAVVAGLSAVGPTLVALRAGATSPTLLLLAVPSPLRCRRRAGLPACGSQITRF